MRGNGKWSRRWQSSGNDNNIINRNKDDKCSDGIGWMEETRDSFCAFGCFFDRQETRDRERERDKEPRRAYEENKRKWGKLLLISKDAALHISSTMIRIVLLPRVCERERKSIYSISAHNVKSQWDCRVSLWFSRPEKFIKTEVCAAACPPLYSVKNIFKSEHFFTSTFLPLQWCDAFLRLNSLDCV